VFPAQATAALYAAIAPRPRSHHIYYGINSAIVDAAPPFLPAVGKLNVLCLGSVEARKGQDVLLRALESLPDALRTRFEVHCLGAVLEAAYFHQLAPRARELGNVHFYGSVPHEQALAALRASDILALPSRDEVLPVVMLEAMASGKAIVASAVGGIPEAIRHEHEGLLFPAGDFRALAAQLARLAEDAELRQRLGAAAAERHAAQFSAERFVLEMESIVKHVL
jgi:glycosyltransferase involved in cell wall biosynthesis